MKKTVMILTAVCIAAALVSVFFLTGTIKDAYEEESRFRQIRQEWTDDDSPDPPLPGDPYPGIWKKIHAKNKDFIYWLTIPGTKIDYPVMQRKSSPEYYLHRSFDRKYSASGTPFLSEISDPEKPSDNLIIYGHHMRAGTMFAVLPKFESESFYKEHKEIHLLTKSGLHIYKVFCTFKTRVGTGSDREFRYYDKADLESEADFDAFISAAKEKEFFDTGLSPSYGDQIITLSTCEYSGRNGRFVVLGVFQSGRR
jgi:sortase B